MWQSKTNLETLAVLPTQWNKAFIHKLESIYNSSPQTNSILQSNVSPYTARVGFVESIVSVRRFHTRIDLISLVVLKRTIPEIRVATRDKPVIYPLFHEW